MNDIARDPLRLETVYPIDHESATEHVRNIQQMLDDFPLEASQAEQSIYLLNVRRRASLALAAIEAGKLKPEPIRRPG